MKNLCVTREEDTSQMASIKRILKTIYFADAFYGRLKERTFSKRKILVFCRFLLVFILVFLLLSSHETLPFPPKKPRIFWCFCQRGVHFLTIATPCFTGRLSDRLADLACAFVI